MAIRKKPLKEITILAKDEHGYVILNKLVL